MLRSIRLLSVFIVSCSPWSRKPLRLAESSNLTLLYVYATSGPDDLMLLAGWITSVLVGNRRRLAEALTAGIADPSVAQ
jgi:hypothetical protein